MAHEPKLSAYIIKLNPKGDDIENSNRNLVKTLQAILQKKRNTKTLSYLWSYLKRS